MVSQTMSIPLMMMVLSSSMVISTKQWVLIWLMLEVSTISYIMYLSTENKKEKIMVFFIFQTLPSMVLMTSIFNMNWSWEQSNSMVFLFVFIAIFMKIGVFPYNTWMMKFNSKIEWTALTMLLTWQKIIPIIILIKWSSKNSPLLTICLILMVMSMILLKATKTKILVSISSINHNLWMMVPMFTLKMFSLTYLFLYSMIIMAINIFFWKSNFKNFMNQSLMKKYFTSMVMKMCSLSGVPPTTGFFLKMMIMFSLITLMALNPNTITSLIVASSLSFFVYSQMIVKNLMLFKTNSTNSMKSSPKKTSFLFLTSATTPIIMFL